MELADGNSGSANEENKVEDGEKCEKVEEVAKLKEESIKSNGVRLDQVEKTKGKGLKKWKRRRREANKDAGHASEPQRIILKRVAPLDASKGENKVKNEVVEHEPPLFGNSVASPSALGFSHSDRESDSGSWNAVMNFFPLGYGEDQSSKSTTGVSFPKDMADHLAAEEFLNELDFGLIETREESNYPPLYGPGIELPLDLRAFGDGNLRAFGDGNRKRPAGPAKKARAEKIDGGNAKFEDPHDEDSSLSTGRVLPKCEGISLNHTEEFSATLGDDLFASCIIGGGKREYLDDHGESSCSTANNIGNSAVNASGHSKAVMADSGAYSANGDKQDNLNDLGESPCSNANNLCGSAVGDSGESKAMMTKSGSNVRLGCGVWETEELRLWYENFDPENSTFEKQNSEEALVFGSDERGSVSHDRYPEGLEVRENPVPSCEDVAHSSESPFASVVVGGAKKREETGDSGPHVEGTNLQPGKSDCLVRALNQLQTAGEALQQEVQQIKDLEQEFEAFQMKDFENSSFESQTKRNHLGQFDVRNGSHVGEKAEIKWPSAENQLNKLNEKLKLLQEELEESNQKTLSEQAKIKDLEVQCKDQEIKLKEINVPGERTASDSQLLQEKCKEMEKELEEQYKEKWQAEIEYLIFKDVVTRNIALVENESSLLQEQKALVIEQLQTALKLKHTEGRALSLKDHLKELENTCSSLLEMEEVLTLHNRVCGFSLFSFIQFILLCFAILVMFAQSPHATDLVPT